MKALDAVEHPAAVDLARRVVRVPAASEPAPGSVSAQAPIFSPRGERRDPALPLLVVAELVDVVGARASCGRRRDADRRIDLRQLGDHEHVLDVAEAGAAELLGEDDAEEAELRRLAPSPRAGTSGSRRSRRRSDRPRGGRTRARSPDGALLVGEGKVHLGSCAALRCYRAAPGAAIEAGSSRDGGGSGARGATGSIGPIGPIGPIGTMPGRAASAGDA